MSSASRDTTLIEALAKLDPLEPNRYIIALGPVDEQFIGSPSGYIASRVSSSSSTANGITQGSLKKGTLHNVQWHACGSYYAKSSIGFAWNSKSEPMHHAWNDMWKDLSNGDFQRIIGKELASLFISPYSNEGDTFALIKQQSPGHDPPFIVHFEGEPVHSNLEQYHTAAPENVPSSSNSVARNDGTCPDQRVQPTSAKREEAAPSRMATSKKFGRPHSLEERELKLKKGERVTVIETMGRDWFMGVNTKGIKGYVHGSWLDFDERKMYKDGKAAAYLQFRDDMKRLLVPGGLHDFPVMTNYVNACDKVDCKRRKEDPSSLGICIHDLGTLLSASDSYSYEWLKDGRNLWHPDRFARFCQAGQAERLKLRAECMFVMYGKLMDKFRT
ncbi:hypothetical protein TW65_01059 [Stemphylium lycopersici]|nr:hypothetical protein TW65_01059 [Stemphylium lycopersici]